MGDTGKQRVKDKNITCVLVICMVAIYFIRLLFLDADVKNSGIGQVCPADELYYNEIGLLINRCGVGSILDGNVLTGIISNGKTFILPSLLTAISMGIFGNNFYGLKIPYVLMGFVAAFFLYHIARKLFAGRKTIVFLVMAAYIFDFNLFMLSREAVTVLPCMLACTIFLYGTLMIKKDEARLFFMGFWSVTTFCLIYAGMELLIVTTFLYALVLIIMNKQGRGKKAAGCLAGVVIAAVISDMFSLVLFRQHMYKTILDVLAAHSGKLGTVSSLFSIKSLVYRAVHYWASNMFQYNYLFLVLGVCAFVLCMYGMVLKKDMAAVILWMLVGSHWAQTFFLDNMTDSKAAITFPILLLMVPYAFLNYGRDFLSWRFVKGKGRVLFGTVAVCALLFNTAFLLIFKTGLEKIDKYILLATHVAILALLMRWIVSWKKRMFYLAFSISAVFMVYASGKYVLAGRTYTMRDTMIDLGETTGDGHVINGTGYGLYNQCDAPADIYDHYKGVGYNYDTMYAGMVDAVYQYDELYYIGKTDPEDEWSIDKLNELLKDSPYEFVKVKTYPLEWWNHVPHDQDHALYIKKNRSGISE